VTESAAVAVDCHAPHGEGPTWDARRGLVVWVSIMQGTVYTLDPGNGHTEQFEVGEPIGAIVPRASGGYCLAVEHGFAAVGELGEQVQPIASIQQDGPAYRMNDAKCDPAGRFWAGTMAYDETPGCGVLYRLSIEGQVETMLSPVTISNGLGWSPDNTRMYYIDTPTAGVDVFDYDLSTGKITDRRRLITVPAGVGHPDGMTVDAEGYLWVALWGGGAVHRYAPDGTLERIVQVPATNTSSCVFGGADLADLYITSAAHPSPDNWDKHEHAGDLFVYRPGVSGLPTNSYRG
jgi:sugar lactone lactonase YvrE